MDAGGHPQDGDADVAVALLEEKVKDRDAEAMLVLGVCCEFGMGTEQDVLSSCTRVEQARLHKKQSWVDKETSNARRGNWCRQCECAMFESLNTKMTTEQGTGVEQGKKKVTKVLKAVSWSGTHESTSREGCGEVQGLGFQASHSISQERQRGSDELHE